MSLLLALLLPLAVCLGFLGGFAVLLVLVGT